MKKKRIYHDPVRELTDHLCIAERAMENGELVLAFEMIGDILDRIRTERTTETMKAKDIDQRARIMDISGRCLFLKGKLITEMAKNL